jgi:hypothetical protein
MDTPPVEQKKKTTTKRYTNKDVFDKLPQKEKSKVISKVKKVVG